MPEQTVLTTERLVLRPHRIDDAPVMASLLESGDITARLEYLIWPYDTGIADQWLEGLPARREPGAVYFAATLRETGDPRQAGDYIGDIGLSSVDTGSARAELGYWFGKPYWGRGYGTEAARAVIDYGFNVLGLNRIWATHFHTNPASGRVMQKIGMTHEGSMRRHVKKNGEYVDFEVYGILREEYQAQD